MTQPSENNAPSERKPPEILSDEDMPLQNDSPEDTHKGDPALSKLAYAERLLPIRKFAVGSAALGWSMALMIICIILSIWQPNNELLKNGFEAFKLIAMTILGYIFGSSVQSNSK